MESQQSTRAETDCKYTSTVVLLRPDHCLWSVSEPVSSLEAMRSSSAWIDRSFVRFAGRAGRSADSGLPAPRRLHRRRKENRKMSTSKTPASSTPNARLTRKGPVLASTTGLTQPWSVLTEVELSPVKALLT